MPVLALSCLAGGASPVTDLGAIEPTRTQAEQLAQFVVRATHDDL